jgi:O-antigen/teichoic acid export membrane protein
MANLLSNVKLNFLAFFVGKAGAAAASLILIRILGPAEAGIYSACLAFAGLFSIISELGLSSWLTREVSQHKDRKEALLAQALVVQGLQVAVAGLALAAFLWAKGSGAAPAGLVALAFLSVASAALSNPFSATLQGLEAFKAVSIYTSLSSILNALALLAALLLWPTPHAALAALAVSGLAGLLLWVLGARLNKVWPRRIPSFDIIGLWKHTMPFAAVSGLNQLYVRLSAAMLTWMAGTTAVGYYGAALRVVDLAVPLMVALAGPLYPRLSALALEDPKAMGQGLQRALRFMALVSLPIGFGGLVLASDLNQALFGQKFLESAQALQVLLWVPALVGITSGLFYALNALHRTKLIAMIFGINVLVSALVNWALIPSMGFMASAWASVLCEALTVSMAWWMVARAGLQIRAQAVFYPVAPAAAFMAVCLAFAKHSLALPSGARSLLALAPLGIVAYGAALYAAGFFKNPEDRLWLRFMGKAS